MMNAQPADFKRSRNLVMSSMIAPKVMQHPLVACHLTVLRNKNTRPSEFRSSVNRLSTLLAYSATADLQTTEKPIETPIQKMVGQQLLHRIALIPILRAGVGMVEAMLEMIPTCEVWHLGLYRDEKTAEPVGYYNKLPSDSPVDVAFVLDPMLATGGSAVMACNALAEWGVPRIKMLSIISAPEGIQRLQHECPDVEIHTCKIDERLNDKKFIVPGLGDAGDRIFNTTGQ
jgi:uracil phosphoribosyltransferase